MERPERCVNLAIEKKFVNEGFKKAMIDEFFLEKLDRAGYGGMEINRTPMGTQITIKAEKPGMIIGKSGKMIRKYTKDLDTRFKMDNPQIDVQEVRVPELNAQMMATRLANALERGWYFRKAGQSTLQRIMDSGAMGVEIIIAGKLTGPRKRREKFIAGYIKHCGKPVEEFVDVGYARAKKKLGIIGVKVRIMPPGAVLPDKITVGEQKPAVEAKPEGTVTTESDVQKAISESGRGGERRGGDRRGGERGGERRGGREGGRPPRRDGPAPRRDEQPRPEVKAEEPKTVETVVEEPKSTEPGKE